ncbi:MULTISPECIES: CopG family ribbon-helix-helix protein [Pasteurellaceae]|uniref:Ribbon-helix-helix protein, CopG family n=2 Tax=Pasteurellaceae TaxID=712 RepID=A0AAJ6P1D0_9PAST|nr:MULTISPECIES: ribbon-helix-helix protein, CopG family [Pasteurella]MBR0574577.1 ribbon-helix-helix protein, CopG family [Pasteurella atlantica]MDP8040428.1 ribbon-helix-helix protein, CopG family [Pasteurella atlantica]MDP8042594.1 ribbon-helix-helix protein, CopG family [Pasteurella atlantica]MDP8044711.1 ribbon-helix-helix protein, CopG family [Pasteurella atlantica]MDP8046759.1 ribbon-helix-helix protein, CopG family [Pasteurella atlantica]
MSCSVSVRLEDDIKKRLDEIAKIQDRTPHSLMKRAIERFIQQEDAEREWFKSRVRAMEEDKANGNLVPIEKALEMLRAE